MKDYQIEVEVECPLCNDKFITYQMICDGSVSQYYCSEDCYKDYYSLEKVRERKLENILK